jgi:hypothetical protein
MSSVPPEAHWAAQTVEWDSRHGNPTLILLEWWYPLTDRDTLVHRHEYLGGPRIVYRASVRLSWPHRDVPTVDGDWVTINGDPAVPESVRLGILDWAPIGGAGVSL